MSFTDHCYGENKRKDEENVLQLIRTFLHETSEHPNNDDKEDKTKFIETLETLIETLKCKVKQLKQQHGVRVEDSDHDLVQVHADNTEIERRITAFMQRKQHEVDEINKREFSASFGNRVYGDGEEDVEEESCARTDAVYIPCTGSTSHVKISRVVNRIGPSAQGGAQNNTRLIDSINLVSNPTTIGAEMEERVQNMEVHLNMDSTVVGVKTEVNSLPEKERRASMFERIKKLEERILTLESISPEYVSLMSPTRRKRARHDDESDHGSRRGEIQYQDLSLSQIDERIALLKAKLRVKQSL